MLRNGDLGETNLKLMKKKGYLIHSSKESRMDKIKKDLNKPSPGDYNVVDSFNKTQLDSFNFKIGNSKVPGFVDKYVRSKEYLPGIGSYTISN
jgi:hypothetical protein